MEIIIDKGTYVLGEPIPARVRFTNETGKPMRMEDPAKSTRAFMHAVDQRTREDMCYPMAPMDCLVINPDTDEVALSSRPPVEIEIPPGDTLIFSTDLNENLYMQPGRFDCVFRHEGAESNHVAIEVQYTQSTVGRLLAYAGDTGRDYGRREWATEWLKVVAPDFDLKLPLPNDPGMVVADKESLNQARIAALEQWWKKHQSSIEIPKLPRR